ncbi:rhomboid family intramembrane serine protease [Streptomyces rhizosphaericola]|uniref:rhomboid family intramembrane serine protease n=1 Tax=Streptomyces TaxID=1883 RepID=UPI0004908BFC|nr:MULTISPECIES: rhomboid family intramembrane serine protease [unclassified Streptomyces]MYT94244.1 rhomboid family intramembrane serine protease [Streptomyces sp. SID8359]PWS41204.1 rhomboid family intramembrane serine protease [Streptomyces sp. ZEA17I]
MIDVRRFARWTTAAGARERTAGGAPVTYGLIALCGAVFLISPLSGFGGASYGSQDALLAAQAGYFERWGVIPAELWEGSPRALLTPFTALFVHGSWLHLLGNLLFLYVFGAMAEERMGRVRFALFYVGCGYLALVCYAAVHADSGQTLVGASGAISAVLGAFLYLFPKARVTSLFPFLFFLPLRFPAWIVLVFWFGLQWAAAQAADAGPGVAYLAHVAGFAAGFLCAWVGYGRRARVKVPATATEGDRQP